MKKEDKESKEEKKHEKSHVKKKSEIHKSLDEYAPSMKMEKDPYEKEFLKANKQQKPESDDIEIIEHPIKKDSKDLFPKISSKSEKDIAMDFATQVHRKFSDIVKATVLFGSQATNTATQGSDIDIIIIVDDASIQWDLELVAWYREELAKIINKKNYPYEIHVNTVKLTTWWQDLLYGDPVIINILRYGEVLIDIGGFFNPLKSLLLQGKIQSTPEAVFNALQRAPNHLARSRASEMGAIEGIYWTMVDSAQAALMMAGKMPPSPEHIPQLLDETFVEQKLLKSEFVKLMKEIYSVHKGILHGQILTIKGMDIDLWQTNAERFLYEMTRIIDLILESKK